MIRLGRGNFYTRCTGCRDVGSAKSRPTRLTTYEWLAWACCQRWRCSGEVLRERCRSRGPTSEARMGASIVLLSSLGAEAGGVACRSNRSKLRLDGTMHSRYPTRPRSGRWRPSSKSRCRSCGPSWVGVGHRGQVRTHHWKARRVAKLLGACRDRTRCHTQGPGRDLAPRSSTHCLRGGSMKP